MTDNNLSSTLEPEAAKRLGKLLEDWDKKPGAFFATGLRLQDLRLLLEYCEPLQALIRDIATQPRFVPSATVVAANEQPLCTDTEVEPVKNTDSTLKDALALIEKTQQESLQFKNLYENAQQQHQQQQQENQQLQTQLANQQQENQQLQTQLANQEQENQQLAATLRLTQQKLQQSQSQLAEKNADIQSMAFIRNEQSLSKHFDLDDLPPDNTQALIKVVAVLAQKENVERLWKFLKERCETDKRPVNAGELNLLKAALSWYNHNWKNHPFQLVNIAVGSNYDYEQHQRSTHTSSGETVATLYLPSLADGSDKPLCKALVCTR